jgi:hypothetical protein
MVGGRRPAHQPRNNYRYSTKYVWRGMILGKKIGQVAMLSRLPLHLEVVLSYAVPIPVPPHVHGLGLALGAEGIGHGGCTGVVRD